MSRSVPVPDSSHLNKRVCRAPRPSGHVTLAGVSPLCARPAEKHDLMLTFRQSHLLNKKG